MLPFSLVLREKAIWASIFPSGLPHWRVAVPSPKEELGQPKSSSSIMMKIKGSKGIYPDPYTDISISVRNPGQCWTLLGKMRQEIRTQQGWLEK